MVDVINKLQLRRIYLSWSLATNYILMANYSFRPKYSRSDMYGKCA